MKTIAVIEDDDDSWLLLRNLLIRAGYQPEQLLRFSSIASILPLLAPPQVILTDLGLPDSQGTATFKKVCSLFPESPIIVITGSGDADLGIALIKEGAQDYLVKGEIDYRALCKSIQYAIERKRITTDYKRIFAHNPTPMYILDDKTLDILAVNEATIEKYGYSPEELLLMNANDLRPVEEVSRFVKFAQAQQGDQYDAGVWQHRKKDGTVFAAHVYVHTTEFEGRRARMVVAIDIDKEQKIEQALARDEQNLRAIINNTSDVIWSIDRQYNIISANDAFWKYLHTMTGKKQGEITEADFGNEVFSTWLQFFDRAFAGEAFKTEWRNVFAGEDYISETSFNPIRNELGEIVGASCFSRDVTQEHKLQQKIFTDDANLKAMIDNTEDLIWSIDNNFNLISANRAFLTVMRGWLGRAPEAGDTIFDKKINDALISKWKGLYERALNGEQFVMEQEANDNGATLYTETRFNPIRDINGRVIGVSCFSHDVTSLRTYLQQIEEQNKQLREIAWIQSHKVRNHVASILGLVQVIDLNRADGETNCFALKGIKRSSEDLDAVIREINERTQQLGNNGDALA